MEKYLDRSASCTDLGVIERDWGFVMIVVVNQLSDGRNPAFPRIIHHKSKNITL